MSPGWARRPGPWRSTAACPSGSCRTTRAPWSARPAATQAPAQRDGAGLRAPLRCLDPPGAALFSEGQGERRTGSAGRRAVADGAAPRRARGLPRPKCAPGRLHDARRAHARGPSGAQGVDARAADPLGRRHRCEHRALRHAVAATLPPSRARLPQLSRAASRVSRYGPQRVEVACTLALELGAGQYRHVRDILANGRDLLERPVPAPGWVSPEHDNLRGASYFHRRTCPP
jgi:hypothetical protein